jgi:hypothetical protein
MRPLLLVVSSWRIRHLSIQVWSHQTIFAHQDLLVQVLDASGGLLEHRRSIRLRERQIHSDAEENTFVSASRTHRDAARTCMRKRKLKNHWCLPCHRERLAAEVPWSCPRAFGSSYTVVPAFSLYWNKETNRNSVIQMFLCSVSMEDPVCITRRKQSKHSLNQQSFLVLALHRRPRCGPCGVVVLSLFDPLPTDKTAAVTGHGLSRCRPLHRVLTETKHLGNVI